MKKQEQLRINRKLMLPDDEMTRKLLLESVYDYNQNSLPSSSLNELVMRLLTQVFSYSPSQCAGCSIDIMHASTGDNFDIRAQHPFVVCTLAQQ